jgi:hypothetical protein
MQAVQSTKLLSSQKVSVSWDATVPKVAATSQLLSKDIPEL